MLSLLKSWLQVPIQEDDQSLSGGKGNRLGTPQGGVISPLLANRYMNRFLRPHCNTTGRQSDGERRFAAKLVKFSSSEAVEQVGG